MNPGHLPFPSWHALEFMKNWIGRRIFEAEADQTDIVLETLRSESWIVQFNETNVGEGTYTKVVELLVEAASAPSSEELVAALWRARAALHQL